MFGVEHFQILSVSGFPLIDENGNKLRHGSNGIFIV